MLPWITNPGIGGIDELTSTEELYISQLASLGTNGQVLAVNASEDGVEWVDQSGGGGSGDVVGPASAVDDNIATFDTTTGKLIQDGGATIAQVRDRSTHTGTQTASTISDFDTEVSDNTDVAANTAARHDAVTVTDSATINHTLTGQDLESEVIDDSITFAKMQNIATNRILGRSTAGTGNIEVLQGGDVRDIAGVDTDDSPQFAGINIGHATDTTITRVSAGVIAVEGTNVSLEGHTHTASDVTDFDTEVANNSAVAANTAKVSYPGSADATELNILDGATVTTAELNILDGVTATTAEINKLDGVVGNVVGTTDTQTLTNKTIDDANNTLSNIAVSSLANGTDGELITWDATGAPATVSAGTADQVLTSNGPGAAPTFQDASGGGADVQVFTSSGTWTKPASGTRVKVQIWGAGGSGERRDNQTGGSGGGGSYIEGTFDIDDLSATETVTIGAGGASKTGSNQAGDDGENSTFGALITAYGGIRGGHTNSNGGAGAGIKGKGTGGTGGDPEGGAAGSPDGGDSLFGGGGGGSNTNTVSTGGDTIHGGGGGGGSVSPGGDTIYGGGGGGNPGGSSVFGGDGGNQGTGSGSTGNPGQQPGGGGGSGADTSGAGGDGMCIVTTL